MRYRSGMIASFAHKFIFIKLRKTAGTSIELALSSLCGVRDIITPLGLDDEVIRKTHGWRGPQNFSDEPGMNERCKGLIDRGDEAAYREMRKGLRRSKAYNNHMPADRARRMLGEEFWQSAYKWTVERHPYEKAVSRAYFVLWLRGLPVTSLQDVLEDLVADGRVDERHLYTIDGKLAVDRVIRHEDLPGAFNLVLAKSGLRFDGELPRAKISQRADRRPAREILSKQQRTRIYASCRATFELLGYEA